MDDGKKYNVQKTKIAGRNVVKKISQENFNKGMYLLPDR